MGLREVDFRQLAQQLNAVYACYRKPRRDVLVLERERLRLCLVRRNVLSTSKYHASSLDTDAPSLTMLKASGLRVAAHCAAGFFF